MTTSIWRYAAGMIRAHPKLFAVGLLVHIPVFCLALVPGLIVREVFDRLSGQAPAGLNVWTLIGLMVAVKPWLKRSLPIGARRLGVIVGRFISPLLRRAR